MSFSVSVFVRRKTCVANTIYFLIKPTVLTLQLKFGIFESHTCEKKTEPFCNSIYIFRPSVCLADCFRTQSRRQKKVFGATLSNE